MMSLIDIAVAPLKADAITRAGRAASEMIANAAQQLAAANNDLHVVAPFPPSNISRAEYAKQYGRYKFFSAICTWRRASISHNEPCFADLSPTLCEKFINDAKEDAAFQYEAFAAKLNAKIGAVTAARLEGNHVWSFSKLFVTTAAGEEQIWKTTMIINCSKLGKLFNQFPTRKVKA